MDIFFEKIKHYNWNLPKKDRSLDQNLVDEYIKGIESFSHDDAEFVRDIINSTKYIPFDEFKSSLIESFNLFKKNINDNPFYILLNWYRVNSEHWFIALLWEKIKKLNFAGFINDTDVINLDKNYRILLIDDAMYSGATMLGRMDGFSYNLAEYYKTNQKSIAEHFTFDIVCPYVSLFGKQELENFKLEVNFRSTIYNTFIIKTLNNKYPDELFQKFKVESFCCPIYFDHKVASFMSSFPSIYCYGYNPYTGLKSGILLKNSYSREKIVQFKNFYEKYKINIDPFAKKLNSDESHPDPFAKKINNELKDLPLDFCFAKILPKLIPIT